MMLSKFEYDGNLNPAFSAGGFCLPITCLAAYLPRPVAPRVVHVSSAGVTRPMRPGINLDQVRGCCLTSSPHWLVVGACPQWIDNARDVGSTFNAALLAYEVFNCLHNMPGRNKRTMKMKPAAFRAYLGQRECI